MNEVDHNGDPNAVAAALNEAEPVEPATTPVAAPAEEPKSIYELFEADEAAEQNGITIDFGEYGEFIIARAGGSNKRFRTVAERKMRPYRRQADNETLPEDVIDRIAAETFAETVMLGWNNVRDKQKLLIPYSVENCIRLFKELPQLFEDLRNEAMKFANFRQAEMEDDAKN